MSGAMHSLSAASSAPNGLWRTSALQSLQAAAFLMPGQIVLRPAISCRLQRYGAAPAHRRADAAASPAGFLLQHEKGRGSAKRYAAGSGSQGSCVDEQQQQQQQQQYALLRIAGDGRCMFRSLAHGSHLAAQEEAAAAAAAAVGEGSVDLPAISLLSLQEETAKADQLRQAICAELLKRRDELWFFIDEDYDSYVHRMQQPHTWGGEPELAVACHVLQRPVAVFMQRDSQLALVSCYGAEEYGGKQDVPLFFHGAGHYDLLVRPPAVQQKPRSKL